LGINIPILWGAQIARGYATAKWMTYKHAQELGGSRPGRAKPGRFAFDD
jgi:antirestriction protein ArdC